MNRNSGPISPRREGSVLMFALIAAIILAVTLASLIGLSVSNMRNADRSMHLHSAINVAEAGVDEALWAINKYQLLGWTAIDDTAFTGWTVTGTVFTTNAIAQRTVVPFSHGVSTSEFSSLLSWGANTQRPTLAVRARVTLPGSKVVDKYLWCQLARRSLFAAGLVARRDITFSGNNVAIDSYRSDKGAYTPGPSTSNRFDNGSVASASVQIDPVVVGNADIWGRVATGGSAPKVGPNGTIASFGSAPGTVDPSRVSSDFQANLDPLGQPSQADIINKAAASPGEVEYLTTLPAKTGSDYVLGKTSGTTAGSAPPVQYYYLAGNVTLSGTEHIVVQGPVVLVVMSGSFKAAGNTGIDIKYTTTGTTPNTGLTNLFTAGSSVTLKDSLKPPLTIFANGDFDLSGKGLLNDPATSTYAIPAAVQIYGTSTTTQDIKIAGNGILCATVFAPNAAVSTVGNGDTYGSIVADTIKYTGNGAFHYDESLDDVRSGKWAIEFWKELLTADERSGAWEGKTYTF